MQTQYIFSNKHETITLQRMKENINIVAISCMLSGWSKFLGVFFVAGKGTV